MAATSVEIVNLALDRIGEAPITALADDNTTANLCERHYASTVQEVLMSHRWNFATKRTILSPTWVEATSYAQGVGDPFEVTSTTHGLSTGQRVTFNASVMYPNLARSWRVTVTNANVFTLDDSEDVEFDGDGTVDNEWTLAAHWDWAYSIALPSDCLRALEDELETEDMNVRWEIESGRVLTNQEEELEFKYIYDVTTVTLFPPLFLSTLILTLAIKFKVALQGAGADVGALAAELTRLTAPLAKKIDANESQRRERLFPQQSLFVAARGAGL